MRRRFVTLDVFTDRRFTGNPLAVVLDSDAIDTAGMQRVAREFNLSETVFVLPSTDRRHRARLRIFTPAAELPFAGHPIVGTAVLLALADGRTTREEMILEVEAGLVRCAYAPRAKDRGYVSLGAPRLSAEAGAPPAAENVAAALGLDTGDIGFGAYAPAAWSAGNPFVFMPVRDLDALRRSRPNPAKWEAAMAGIACAFVFCRQPDGAKNTFRARMFAPALGVAEDPASGSAAAAIAGMIARHASLMDGEHEFRIEQGHEMGRPSLMTLGMTIRNGALAAASVGGEAITVAEGTIEA
jgi:trans-2,3-dihydro-3-hydroxyanthranilate isomerase